MVWYADVCPFTSPLLSSPAFLTLLSPLVKHLSLVEIDSYISPDEFDVIWQLTNLVELHISGLGHDQGEEVC